MAIAGSGITYKVWASSTPKAKFLLIHGLGANSLWWESFASTAVKKDLSSYAIDLREHKSFAGFFNAVGSLLTKIREESPRTKIFAIGESMGALIILSMALKNQAIFDGIVCISPALKSSTPLKPLDYLKMFLPLFYNRDKTHGLPVTADMCTRDPEYLKVIKMTYDKDAMSTSQALFDIFIVQLRMRLLPMRIDSPLLFLIAGHDLLVYSGASVRVFGRLKCKDKALIEYPGMYHSLSVDLGKEKVFQDILEWVAKRI